MVSVHNTGSGIIFQDSHSVPSQLGEFHHGTEIPSPSHLLWGTPSSSLETGGSSSLWPTSSAVHPLSFSPNGNGNLYPFLGQQEQSFFSHQIGSAPSVFLPESMEHSLIMGHGSFGGTHNNSSSYPITTPRNQPATCLRMMPSQNQSLASSSNGSKMMPSQNRSLASSSNGGNLQKGKQ